MRTTTLRAAVLVAFALGLPMAAAQAPSATAAPAAQSTPAVDAAWGQYATLAGTRARAGTDGYELRWYWAEPGRELVQEYINPGTAVVAHREVIKPGATPGSLVLTSSALGKKQWLGTVQPDGRVLFVGKGLLKLPYLAGRAADGAWELTPVDLADGRVAAEKPASKYARFMPFEAADARPVERVADAPASSPDPAAARTAAAPVASAAPATAAPESATPAPSAMGRFAAALSAAKDAVVASVVADVPASTSAAPAAATAPATAAVAATAAAPASAPAPAVQPDTPEVALLRSVIEGFRSGQPPYERMEPATADALRRQMPTLGPQWANVDATRSIEPNWPLKPYRFLAMHGEQPVEWRMDLAGNGRIASIFYRPVTAEHVTAVRNFGALATLAGRKFIGHTTRASFALESGGHVLAMSGSWGTVRLQRNATGGLDAVPGPGHNTSKAVATLERDGRLSLELSYRGGLTAQTGTRRHRITANPDGSGFHEEQHWRNGGITLVGRDYEWQNDRRFVPLNDRNVAEQQRYAAEARAERARQRAEEQASRDAAFAGFMNGLQQAGQAYQQETARIQAMNDQLAHATRMAQEQQRLAQQRQREQAEAARHEAERRRIAALAQPSASASPAPTSAGPSSTSRSTSPAPTSTRPSSTSTSTSPSRATSGSMPTSTSTAATPPRTPAPPRGSGTSMPSPAGDKPVCRTVPGKTVTQRSIPLSSREAAENHVRAGSRGACPRSYGQGTLGAITCTTKSEPLLKVDGKGVHKTGERTMYTCSAPVSCPPVEYCESKPSGASRQ